MIKALICTVALAAASPALALEVSKSAEFSAPPAKVWEAIGDFCGISRWHPVIEKCVLSTKNGKQLRTLTLKGGGSILEEELSRDDAKRAYSYKILESPLPVSDYEAIIEVTPSAAGSMVTWSGTFAAKGIDDAKAMETIGGIYVAGFDGLTGQLK